MSGFVHLHCHSVWSLLDGVIPAELLPHIAAELGYEAVAMTDHDSLLGAVRFARACRDAGVKPIFGAELTLADGGHVTALARNATGYANLCRLISDAHLGNERGRPATTMAKIAERAEGLFVLSGCAQGEVARLAAAGALPQALAAARRWRDAIGDGFRLEVFDHRSYGSRTLRNRLLGIADELSLRAVATNDVHYPAPDQARIHELLNAIRRLVPLSQSRALRANSEYGFKAPRAMRELFGDRPEVADETMVLAAACEFELDLRTYHFPELPLPVGVTASGLLARRCYEGARRRYDRITRAVDERLQHELGLIFRMGFAAYFLLVADIVDAVRAMGIRCACRGSAAGSLVCYVLGISDVDPIRYDLLFERFMNARRDELPDIDLDVESHRREEVLEHVARTYGAEQTAVCCMVDTFRARMAIREVGKAVGLPADEIDLVAKAFPRIAARDIPTALDRLPELADTNLRSGQLEELFELCLGIDGFPRHLALHPSGVILSSPDLAARVPMQSSFGGFTMLQADKDDVEELGLVKLDVLGVRMLSAISHCVGEIESTRGEQVDLASVPRDDRSTFELMRASNTLGCFQIESPGQRELLARFQPSRFEDLIVDISLFRPGPVRSDMVTPYLQRRHGFEPIVYPHDRLKPILAETNGVIVFHEQVIRVIAAATGCSLDDADSVRRHLDDRGDAQALGAWFRSSAVDNGFTAEQADALWNEVYSFAAFGFCRSHAAAFALPAYISAYLKAHYPAEFLAGVLTHEPGMYPARAIVADARQLGIPILPIDVNASDAVYRVERTGDRLGIRIALSAVRDICDAEIASLVAARPFVSLEDLRRRAHLSRPVLENLVHVGALDRIAAGRSRRELLWRALDLAGEPPVDAGAQLQLALDETIARSLPELPAYTPTDETQAELQVSQIDARRHVMDLYRPLLAELGCTTADRLRHVRNGDRVWVAGVKVSTQTPAIRSGQRIIFLTLDDVTGPVEVTMFERVQPRCARTVFHSWLLLVHGEVRKRGGASRFHETDPNAVGITVVAEEAFDLAELSADRNAGTSLADALERQRRRQAVAGLGRAAASPKVWHASGGSAGR